MKAVKSDNFFEGLKNKVTGKKEEPPATSHPFNDAADPPQKSSKNELPPVNKPGIAMTKEERERLTREAKRMFVDELRLRVDSYFRVVVVTLRVDLW